MILSISWPFAVSMMIIISAFFSLNLWQTWNPSIPGSITSKTATAAAQRAAAEKQAAAEKHAYEQQRAWMYDLRKSHVVLTNQEFDRERAAGRSYAEAEIERNRQYFIQREKGYKDKIHSLDVKLKSLQVSHIQSVNSLGTGLPSLTDDDFKSKFTTLRDDVSRSPSFTHGSPGIGKLTFTLDGSVESEIIR